MLVLFLLIFWIILNYDKLEPDKFVMNNIRGITKGNDLKSIEGSVKEGEHIYWLTIDY